MKAVLIGLGVIGVGLGLGVWLAMSGGASEGKAKTRVAAVPTTANASGFDYATASLEDRRLWLTKQAKPMAKLFNQTLPKGVGDQPHMSVRGWAVDARRRAIEIQVQVKGQYGIDMRSLPAAKKAMVGQVCPGYATSPLGSNRVTLVHTFLGKGGREDLSVEINPLVCRAYM